MHKTNPSRFPQAVIAFSIASLLVAHSASANTLNWDPGLAGAGGGGTGTWNANSTANWWNGTSDVKWTDPSGVDTAVFDNSSATVSLGSNVTANALWFKVGGYTISGSSTLTLAGATPTITTDTGTTTISSAITGSSVLTKAGAGTLSLSGSNNYTGTTTVSAGTLALAPGSNSGTLSGDFINNATTTFDGSGTGQYTLSGNISGNGSWTIDSSNTTHTGKNWSGRLIIAPAAGNTASLSGTITVQNYGYLWFGNPTTGSIAMTSAINLKDTTSQLYVYGAAGNNYQIGTLTGSGVVDFMDGNGGKSLTLTIGADNGIGTFSGVIKNSGASLGPTTLSLSKTGSGVQTLTGNNSYSGTTTVQQGTLALGTTGTISSNLVLGVSGGTTGTLDLTAKTSTYTQAKVSGNGTINLAAGQTINISATLAPGFGPGQLTFNGNLSLASGTTTTMELAGTVTPGSSYDNIISTGSLTLAGTLNIVAVGAYNINQPGTYSLFNAGSFSGDFTSVSVGGTALTLSNSLWGGTSGVTSYSLNDATGVLTVVPEPSGLVSLIGGVGMLLGLRRRRS
jgi:autotransporter-associated beta strand protein